MLIDDLKEQLKQTDSDISTIKAFWANARLEESYQKLKTESLEEDFWKNPQQATISKELQNITNKREQYNDIIKNHEEFPELITLFEHDEEELKKLQKEIVHYLKMIRKFKISLLLHEEQDSHNCFLNINAGAGGTESQDWSEILLRMYLRFCEREKFQVSIIDHQTGEAAGIKSATLFIKGPNAYGLLKGEHGIHRLVRISPFDANKRRHTSFAAVFLTPEFPDINVTIDPKDLRIDTYRAGGAGGQHVNKTDSAVESPIFLQVSSRNAKSNALKHKTKKLP